MVLGKKTINIYLFLLKVFINFMFLTGFVKTDPLHWDVPFGPGPGHFEIYKPGKDIDVIFL